MVTAAAADAKVRSPPPPLKALLSRSIAASVARAHGRLSQAAVAGLLLVKASGDTFLCLSLASVWLLAASLGAMNLGRVFCVSDDCGVVDAGVRIFRLAELGIGCLGAPAMVVFIYRVAVAGSDTDDKEGRAPRGFAAAAEEVLGNRTLMLGVLASVLFHLLIIAAGLMKVFSLDNAKGSAMEQKMSAVGTLGKDAVWCFVIVPAVALRVWRVTRPGWRCYSAIEKNP